MAGGPDAARTLRAAAEVFIPGSSQDATPGAGDIEADRFLSHYLEYLMPGLADGLPALLDEAARAVGAASFAEASPEDRARALTSLEEHEIAEVRDIPRLLAVLTLGAFYGAWSGQDEEGSVVRVPAGWRDVGFDGPSRGRRRLLRDG